jgi:metallo-beta-lactamase family protein
MHSLPIYLNSPLAIDVTDLYLRHREDHNLETTALESKGEKPFSPPNVHFVRSVDQSKALNEPGYPMVIIAGSGMASGGRVVHHLEHGLPDHRNTVLFVGFQAPGTRGQMIKSGAPSVKMHGQIVPIRAHVESIENLSGHADYGEILHWLGQFHTAPRKTFLVHGEPRAAEALRQRITQQLHWDVAVPTYLQKVQL